MLFILFFLDLCRIIILAQDTAVVDTSPDTCRCYCCPSPFNPSGQGSCDIKSPPLAGSVALGGGSGVAACNPTSCYTYFAVQCPPPGHFKDKGAAVRAGCRDCPDGPFGNGTSATNSQSNDSNVGNNLNNYVNGGGNLQSHASRSKLWFL